MVNTFLYKLFNPDLKNLTNNKLIYHWNTTGIKENRISSIEDFIRKYSDFNLNSNKNGNYKDNLEEMVKWHLNKIDINKEKLEDNKSNKNNFFLLNKEILSIYISIIDISNYNNFYIKSLSKLNYFNMNIIIIIDDYSNISNDINNISFLKNMNYILYDKNKSYPIFDYLITYTYIEKFINNTKSTVFLLNDKTDKIDKIDKIDKTDIILDINNVQYVDNIFNYDYLKNFIFISEYDCYKLYNNLLYKIKKSDLDKIYSEYKSNKLYISNDYLYNNFLDIYTYEFLDISYLILENIDFYFINLEKRKDRLKDTIQELENKNIYQYTRFNALMPSKINKMLNPTKAWKKDYEYLKSALGCKMSHLEIMKSCIDNSKQYLCILEDDVVLSDDAITNLNLALEQLNNINPEWNILYFSTNLKNKCDAIKIDKNLLEIKKGLTTTAQLFQTRKLKDIINIIENSENEIDNVYNEKLKYKYSIYPMIAYQRNSYSDINNQILDYGYFHRKFNYE